MDTIADFLLSHDTDMSVYLVIFDRKTYTIGGTLFDDIAAFIDERYGSEHPHSGEEQQALSQLDETFSQMLLRKMGELGITDAQCYKKANIDSSLFCAIQSDIHYKPSKPTAMAFAVALELPLEEVREMLGKAGFVFSHASKFDIIAEYFISHQNYNIFEINEALFAFDQSQLGG